MSGAFKLIQCSGRTTLFRSTAALRAFSSTSSSSSSTTTATPSEGHKSDIKKSVFISQSHDIFTNLALEDWIYKNFDFTNHHVLMLWANDPCVVIGRHQNPFTETNVSKLVESGITLARRNSGGGAVTMIVYNLNIITRALFREWNIKADLNERDDIVIGGKKVMEKRRRGEIRWHQLIRGLKFQISGTAAKLGHNAYHHCTLLVNANKLHLGESLAKEELKYVSKATASVRSQIKNLCDVNKTVNVPQLLSAVGYEFLRTSATELVDGGHSQTMKQQGFQLINPTEKWFPGITEIRDMYASWDWCLGKTPRFEVEKEIQIKADNNDLKMTLKVEVDKGLMTNIELVLPTGEKAPIVTGLQNKPYDEASLHGIINALKLVPTENVKEAINGL
uniref:BPL/LPL catalytic domain-containing protein n=1 Tax=Megaselia scalaris TaxID=36166 RepID=T1GJX9_MEGSC